LPTHGRAATKDVYGLTLNYAYDAAGNDTLTTDPLNGSTSMSYNQINQLSSTRFSDGTTTLRADFTYNANGDASITTRYKDLAGNTSIGTTVNSYDDARRVTSIVSSDSTSTTVAKYAYTYDNANRVAIFTTLASSDTYTYDPTNQLIGDAGSASASFSYDANGNRNMAGYTTGADNRISSDGTFTYTYDIEGNITGKTKGAGLETWYFGYNNRNMLVSVRQTTDGTTNEYTANYTYDVLNRRVLEVDWQTGVGSSTTRMGYEKNNTLWADLTTSNALTMRYVTGTNAQQLIARVDGSGNVGWYLQDKQATVRDILNATGSVVDTIQFGAFGNVLLHHSRIR
jgi:YD repeat-containing protein